MSLSYQKRRLLAEAVRNYRTAKNESSGHWHRSLDYLMTASGWKVCHSGMDKFVAIKGPIVSKWNGDCRWSESPIVWERRIYRRLYKIGLQKHNPRIYLYLGDFIVQQNIGTIVPKQKDVDDFCDTVDDHGYCLVDCHIQNVRVFNGKLKILDGDIFQKGEVYDP